ncbi:MAG: hypothetical protein L7H18_02660 [Candidatus Nealsonbacteria bacterium DGGOD1a]|jgi:hypothetical protein|nr:MAG: hypothetical protein L7H18_02660 [Candidatus Nealsonbacteria bacterium DGGOD1a]
MKKDCQITIKSKSHDHLLLPKKRSLIWQKLRGKWQNKTNIITDYKKIRSEWNRKVQNT